MGEEGGATHEQQVVILRVLVQVVLQPLHVVHQVLHGVQQPAIGAQPHLVHHVIHADEAAHVKGHAVAEGLRGGVKVGHAHGAARGSRVLLHGGTVGGLARARGAHHELRVANH